MKELAARIERVTRNNFLEYHEEDDRDSKEERAKVVERIQQLREEGHSFISARRIATTEWLAYFLFDNCVKLP